MDKNKTNLTIEQSLGCLKEINLGNVPALAPGQTDRTKKFAVTRECIRCWQDYGQYNEDRLEILVDGARDNIGINGYTFFPVVKDIFYWQKSSSVPSHKFTLSYRTPKGELSDSTFIIHSAEVLPYIIYAMVLISKEGEASTTFWELMNNTNKFTLGELIDWINRLEGKAKRMMEDYPFMEKFFQNLIKQIADEANERLSKVHILK